MQAFSKIIGMAAVTLCFYASPALAAVINFDDLIVPVATVQALPVVYAGFNWTTNSVSSIWAVENNIPSAQCSTPCAGYINGTVSQTNAAIIAGQGTGTFTANSGPFNFNSAYFTDGRSSQNTTSSSQNITISDNLGDIKTALIDTSGPLFITFDWVGISSVSIVTDRTNVVIDNITYNEAISAVPEPSTLAMMIFGFAGLGFFAYRRRTAKQSSQVA